MPKKFKNANKLCEVCWFDEFSVFAFFQFIDGEFRFMTKNRIMMKISS